MAIHDTCHQPRNKGTEEGNSSSANRHHGTDIQSRRVCAKSHLHNANHHSTLRHPGGLWQRAQTHHITPRGSFLPLNWTPEHPSLFCSTLLAGALQTPDLFSGREQRGQQQLVLSQSHQICRFRLDRGETWAFHLVKKAWKCSGKNQGVAAGAQNTVCPLP